MSYLDVREVKQQMAGRWGPVLLQLAPDLAPFLDRPGKHGPCPVHGGSNGFRLYRDVMDTGGGVCNTCGSFADGFKLLSWLRSRTFREALLDVSNTLGMSPRAVPMPALITRPKAVSPKSDDKEVRRRLRCVLDSSVTPDADQAEPLRRYLRTRGFSLVPAALRCHPGLHWQADRDSGRQGPFPVMLGVVEDSNETAVTLHRTYLDGQGRKAPVPEPKKLMSHPSDVRLQGSFIRLFPAAAVLGVCEGIETAIAVTEATGVPCWPLVSAQFMSGFEPPPGVSEVLVFADKNRPSPMHPDGHGQEAGRQLVEQLQQRGLRSRLLLPPSPIPDGAKDVDWADEFVKTGREGFLRALSA
jgi:putative DNA primase/helicase